MLPGYKFKDSWSEKKSTCFVRIYKKEERYVKQGNQNTTKEIILKFPFVVEMLATLARVQITYSTYACCVNN